MLKMMEAFSKASEYCAVALWVKASNLDQGVLKPEPKNRERTSSRHTHQVKETLICCSSTGKRKSSSSS
jgi:hypothetical protein